MTSTPSPPQRARRLVVRIDLDSSAPPIWRRVSVPGDLRLDRLHDVVQLAMGWTDSHLHAFWPGPGERDHRAGSFATAADIAEGEAPDDAVAEADVRVDQVLREVGDRLFYDYDFGDGWDHVLRLEQVEEADPGVPPMRCLGGERACPPEDVGGPFFWNQVVAHLGGLQVEVDEVSMAETLAWLPPGYAAAHAAAFDLAATDAQLRELPVVDPLTVLREPTLVSLADRLRRAPYGLRLLRDLAAPLGGSAPPPAEEERAAVVRPLRALLDEVGVDGAALTSAGYLRPVHALALFETLGMGEGRGGWIGKGNREDLTPPIRNLRDCGQLLGLVRRFRGRLVLTPLGRRLRGDDDEALWQAVADRLPLGRTEGQRTAAVLVLLAQGHDDPERMLLERATPILSGAGWRAEDGGALHPGDLIHIAHETSMVLDVLSGRGYRRRRDHVPGLASLARAALVG